MKVSLWKSAGATGRQRQGGQSIRGKISAPIPIPNPADDVFSTSNMGTGIAVSHPSDNHKPASQPSPPPSPPRPIHDNTSSPAVSHNGPAVVSGPFPEVAHAKPLDSNHSPPRSVRPRSSSGPSPTSGVTSSSPPRRRANPSSQIRYSVVSGSSQRTGTTSNRDIPQRKKSTIRGALSKLFGRRKKHGSQASVPGEMGAVASTQHRSDPSALNRFGKDGEPKRSASLPITEYDRALRSHSVGPQDITAIESTRNSVHAEFNLTRRRAATTSSQLYAPIRVRDGELVGLSPRPASSHARTSRILGPSEDPGQIGWAITSDSVAGRRRSRSLSGLQGMGEARSGEVRRRSDEIRYWRESYDPAFMSPISSNAPECDDVGVAAADAATEVTDTDRPTTPPEPFNFGSFATMKEMAGMKITQAANMETRILDLEARLLRMEGVMIQLCNAVPGLQAESQVLQSSPALPSTSEASLTYAGSAAPPNPSIYHTAPQDDRIPTGYSTSGYSEYTPSSLGEVPAFIGSLPASGGGGHHVPGDRPTSNVTIRGAGSPAAIPGDSNAPFSADHYATLLSLMETERSTRRALESHVKKLSRTVHLLTMQTGQSIELEPPPTARSFGGQSAFDDDSTEDEDEETEGEEEPSSLTVPPKSNMRSLSLQDSGVAAGPEDTDEDNLSESFATPREERAHVFGAFGEELREEDDDGTRRKAARTLSLSQLTGGVGHGKLEVS